MHPPSNQPSNPSGDLAEAAEINKEDDDSIAKGLGFTVVAITLLLVGAAVVAYFSKDIPQSFKDIKKFGEIGDFVGGILNPIISGCTLFIAYAVWRLQKAELAETRKALQKSGEAMQEQTKIAEQQRSEQRFFDLLNIYKSALENTTESVRCKDGSFDVFIGKEAISRIHSEFLRHTPLIAGLDTEIKRFRYYSNKIDEIVVARNKSYSYSKTVLLIIKILSEDLNSCNNYKNLFLNQLTKSELTLIAAYLIFDIEGDDYLDIATKVDLFSKMERGFFRSKIEKLILENKHIKYKNHAN